MKFSQQTRIGALAGFVATAALAGLLYLLAQLQVLSFIPLDIAEAINHLTPGGIATEGIEALGPLAKILVEISGVILFLLAGVVAGVLLARQRAYTSTSNGLLAEPVAPPAGTNREVMAPDRRAFLRRSGGVLLTVAVGSTAVGELLRRAEEQRVAQLVQQAAASGGTVPLPDAALPAPAKVAAEPGAGAG